MMYSLIKIQKQILPDLIPILQRRYQILQYIGLMEPVGRRNLSLSLGITERVLRSEVTLLKNQKLISVANIGMSLTEEGKHALNELEPFMKELTGISHFEAELQESLEIQRVIIVPGNCDESPWVKKELGTACAHCMKEIIKGKNIIAVTGGSTMAAVSEALSPEIRKDELLFVPARGGIGEDVENQANMICARMANKTHSKYRPLYIPEQVSDEIYDSILKEPAIDEVLNLIKSANIVLHGIGDAMTMAKRRRTNPEAMKNLEEGKAVSEAFGYYFNEKGEVIDKVLTIGLQLEDLANAETIIAVAGGASKGTAIRSYLKQAPRKTILITDEGAAKVMLRKG